jgi:hypothetical protein
MTNEKIYDANAFLYCRLKLKWQNIQISIGFFNHTQNDCRKSCTISLPLKAYESIAIIRLWTEVISKVTNFGLE